MRERLAPPTTMKPGITIFLSIHVAAGKKSSQRFLISYVTWVKTFGSIHLFLYLLQKPLFACQLIGIWHVKTAQIKKPLGSSYTGLENRWQPLTGREEFVFTGKKFLEVASCCCKINCYKRIHAGLETGQRQVSMFHTNCVSVLVLHPFCENPATTRDQTLVGDCQLVSRLERP